jgi:protease II
MALLVKVCFIAFLTMYTNAFICAYVRGLRVCYTLRTTQVVLDENEIAKGFEYSAVSCHEPSPDHKFLAYAVDNNGYETYTLRIKNLETGELLEDVVEEISGK